MIYKTEINNIIKLLEAKDRLIDRLSITDEQKEELKAFFRAHPNYENKIDWNRKDLQWSDFEEILKLEGKSKSQAKKKGIEGLIENKDYRILYQKDPVTIYYPLTHLGSQILASVKTLPAVEGKWCISMNDPSYWNKYTMRNPYYDFFFVFIDNPEWWDIFQKVALCRSLGKFNSYHKNTLEFFTADDKTRFRDKYMEDLEKQYPKAFQKIQDLIDTYPSEMAADEYFDKTGIHVTKTGVLDFIDRSKYLDNYGEELDFKIPEGCIQVAPYVAGGLNFTKITFPKSLEGIGSSAFKLSYYLKKIEFPKGSKLQQIGNEAFAGCTEVQEIILPRGLKVIWSDAFSGCYKVRKLVLPDTVRTLDNFAFRDMEDLEEVTLPKGLRYLGRAPFLDCYRLRKIIYPGTIKEFLTRVTVENQAKNISLASLSMTLEDRKALKADELRSLGNYTIDCIANRLVSKGTWLSHWAGVKEVQEYREGDKHLELDIRLDLICSDMTIPLKFYKKQNWQ